jgi:hypothetical protein
MANDKADDTAKYATNDTKGSCAKHRTRGNPSDHHDEPEKNENGYLGWLKHLYIPIFVPMPTLAFWVIISFASGNSIE